MHKNSIQYSFINDNWQNAVGRQETIKQYGPNMLYWGYIKCRSLPVNKFHYTGGGWRSCSLWDDRDGRAIVYCVSGTGYTMSATTWYSLVARCLFKYMLCFILLRPVCNIGILWPNGWIDQDATWYGRRPQPSHIVLDGSQLPPRKGHSSPTFFGPCLLCMPNGWMDQDTTW